MWIYWKPNRILRDIVLSVKSQPDQWKPWITKAIVKPENPYVSPWRRTRKETLSQSSSCPGPQRTVTKESAPRGQSRGSQVGCIKESWLLQWERGLVLPDQQGLVCLVHKWWVSCSISPSLGENLRQLLLFGSVYGKCGWWLSEHWVHRLRKFKEEVQLNENNS